MQLPRAISLLSNLIQLNTPDDRESSRVEVLKDFPHCGELGNEDNKLCYWNCEWQPFSAELDASIGNTVVVKQHTTSTACLQDCPTIQKCLRIYVPKYEQLLLSGETDITVYFTQVVLPNFECIINDYDGYIVSESCYAFWFLVQIDPSAINQSSGAPCFLEFLPG